VRGEPQAFRKVTTGEMVRELQRATALFQQRAIAAHLGFSPTAQRPPHTPHSEVQ
jgi:hypothetical protein